MQRERQRTQRPRCCEQADPRQETITPTIAVIEEDLKAIESRIVSLRDARSEEARTALRNAEAAIQKYLPMMRETVRLAREVTGSVYDDGAAAILRTLL